MTMNRESWREFQASQRVESGSLKYPKILKLLLRFALTLMDFKKFFNFFQRLVNHLSMSCVLFFYKNSFVWKISIFLLYVLDFQATSIIRSKPKGVSAKDYAAQLAVKLKSSETSWKSKVYFIWRHFLGINPVHFQFVLFLFTNPFFPIKHIICKDFKNFFIY